MKFVITRTSQFDKDEVPPCEGLTREPMLGKWLNYEPTYIKTCWTREFQSLEELVAFVEQQGRVVLFSQHNELVPVPEIEIYDCERD